MRESSPTKITQYRVTVGEVIAVIVGVLWIASLGAIGLAIKFMKNTFNPYRAEAIAHHIMDYTIPGNPRGMLGVNTAGLKFALIASGKSAIPDTWLLVAKVPVNQQRDRSQIEEILDNILTSQMAEEVNIVASRVEDRNFCHFNTPVTIQESQLIIPETPQPEVALTYKASTNLGDRKYILILSTVGENTTQKADNIFNSLKCK
ncbi:hypothetical protein NUACC21_24060 [Scytonema sp. NUACC21]